MAHGTARADTACANLQTVLEQRSQDAGFKSEVLKAQDMHHTTLNRESERLANDVAKVRSEIRCALLPSGASSHRKTSAASSAMRRMVQCDGDSRRCIYREDSSCTPVPDSDALALLVPGTRSKS